MLFILIYSATPKMYGSKPIGAKMPSESEMMGIMHDTQQEEQEDIEKKFKKMKGEKPMETVKTIESSRAKEMADRVKASTVISVGPAITGGGGGGGGGGTEEGTGVKKKEKKPKKIIRTAGGQTWEDNSLIDWDDGKLMSFIVCSDTVRNVI